jgi:release factor glutamine methyltransferase
MNEAELLFTQALGCNRLSLHLEPQRRLTSKEAAFISSALKRRIKGEPLQYILGKTEFMGLEFKVDKNVLIPRPETEVLVECALKYAGRFKQAAFRCLDMCTGCGCIAVSMAKHFPLAFIEAVDVSNEAIKTAAKNAILNAAKINFIQCDLFSGLNIERARYDIITANPPYVASGEISSLQPEVRFEPLLALDGGADGLDFYKRIAGEAPGYLNEGGIILLEIGFRQADKVDSILRNEGKFDIIEIIRDYSGIERVIAAKKGKDYG